MRALLLATLATFTPAAAFSASLSDLIAGATLSEGDVVFSGFFFEDFSKTDVFPEDFEVDPASIEVTTSSTATTVTLDFAFDPAASVAPVAETSIFEFFLDFTASVSGSARELVGVTLSSTETDMVTAAGGSVDIEYSVGPFTTSTNKILIFDGGGTQLSDSTTFAATTSSVFGGFIEGEAPVDGSATLAGYALTFDLSGTAPPPEVVPLPAGLPLMLAGLGALAWLRRRA